MRIIITGGRDYEDEHMLFDVIETLAPEIVYIGDCPTGADAFALQACKDLGIKRMVFSADWKKHGRAAGPIRNKEMIDFARRDGLEEPVLVAFPGGNGTENCIQQAKRYNLIVLRVSQ